MINIMQLAELGKMPDALVRAGIRKQLKERLEQESSGSGEEQLEKRYQFIERIREQPIAMATQTANEQHYELPQPFFATFMGAHMKYSAGLWGTTGTSLDQSEADMLELTCQRAQLADGISILELGCGWGSLTLWMARTYRQASITAVSNSHSQREYIEAIAQKEGLTNLRVITADMNHFNTDDLFDRVVSVEMFEHMRNWPKLLQRISRWMKPEAKLFIHIFVHRELAYLFRNEGDESWMTKYFFQEGMMPAEQLLHMINQDLRVEHHWRVNGKHYAATQRAWLDKLDQNRDAALAILSDFYPPQEALIRLGRWRIFFMACEELFNWKEGEEWYVTHYLLQKN
jgi:cyclopropane-fatty-acyl-phospholipid synthase